PRACPPTCIVLSSPPTSPHPPHLPPSPTRRSSDLAGRRGTAAQQRLRRGQDGCPAAEQLQQHGVATLLARVRIGAVEQQPLDAGDRKSTRLNSSHVKISYAVFCLKKKKCTSDGSAW